MQLLVGWVVSQYVAMWSIRDSIFLVLVFICSSRKHLVPILNQTRAHSLLMRMPGLLNL